MSDPFLKTARHLAEAAREAVLDPCKFKREEPDTFGLPELFIVKADDKTLTWELRASAASCLLRDLVQGDMPGGE